MSMRIGCGLAITSHLKAGPFLPTRNKRLELDAFLDSFTIGGVTHVATNKTDLRIADAAQTGLDPLASDWSLDFWVNFASVAAGETCFVHKGGNDDATAGYEVYRNGTTLKAALSNGTTRVVVDLGTIAAATWYHGAVTFDRDGNAIGYLNAVAGTPADISGINTSINSSVDFYVGSRAGASYAGVSWSALRIWNKKLSAAEVTALYGNKNAQYYGDLASTVGLVSNYDPIEAIIGNPTYVTGASATCRDLHGSNHLTFTAGEMATNGGMSSDTGWTGTTGNPGATNYDDSCEISGGVMHCHCSGDGNPTICSVGQTLTLTGGNSYIFAGSFTRAAGLINLYARNSLDPSSGGEWIEAFSATNATYSEAYTMLGTRSALVIQTTNNAEAEWNVDNLSVKCARLTASNGPSTAIASDSIGTAHGTLTGFTTAQEVTCWSTDTPDGSYTATVTNQGSGGSTYNGTMVNFSDVDLRRVPDAPTQLRGKITHSIQFDGVNDYVSTSYIPPTSGTMCCWVLGNAWQGKQICGSMDSSSGRCYLYLSDGKLRGGIGNHNLSNIKGNTLLSAGWNHCTITWDAVDGVKLYLNGSLDYSGAMSGAVTTTKPLFIGCINENGTASNFMVANIASVQVYSTVLSAADIAILATGNDPTATPVLKTIGFDVPRSIPSCAAGFSLALDGVANYVAIPHVASQLSHPATFSAWVKGTDAEGAVFGKYANGSNNGLNLYLTGGKPSIFYRANGVVNGISGSANGTVNNGAWHHLAWLINASGCTFYVDGVADANVIAWSGVPASPTNTIEMRLGNTYDTSYFLATQIDDVRCYSSALSPAQIAQLASGLEATGATPVGLWSMDDGAHGSPSNGSPIVKWVSQEENVYGFDQPTLSKCPTYVVLAQNSRPGLYGDGIDDYLSGPLAVLTSVDTLSLSIICGPSAFDADQVLWATSDTASATIYMEGGIDAAGKAYLEWRSGGTTNRVTGNTVLSPSDDAVITWKWTGSAWSITVNRKVQTLTVSGTNTGLGPADLSGLDNFTLFAKVDSTGTVKPFEGTILDMLDYEIAETPLTIDRIQRVYQRKYAMGF